MKYDYVFLDSLNTTFSAFHQFVRQMREQGIEELREEHLPFFYHILVNKYSNLFYTFGKIIICNEGKNSTQLRKSYFPLYKANRDEAKKSDNSQLIKSQFKKIDELLSLFPAKLLSVDGCEGDDLMYQLSVKYANQGKKCLIITTDKDLVQAKNANENIDIYSPMQKIYREAEPNIVIEKCIVGDASDGIPGLPRVGAKTFEKMMNDEMLYEATMKKNNNRELVEVYRKVVDLSLLPNEYKQKIFKKEEETDFNPFQPDSIEEFFMENKLKDCFDRWGNTKSKIQATLAGGYKNVEFEDDFFW